MFDVIFYRDRSGEQPVKNYIVSLSEKENKSSRIRLNKIRDYIKILGIHGTHAGIPYIKHIEGNIWELRPLRDRIFFFCFQGDTIVLLHQFMKRTQKTPKREIEQAKRNMTDFIERSKSDEK